MTYPRLVPVDDPAQISWRDKIRSSRDFVSWLSQEFSFNAQGVLNIAIQGSGKLIAQRSLSGASVRPGTGVISSLARAIVGGNVVLWKHEIFSAAVVGAESFVGQPAPAWDDPAVWLFEHHLLVDEAAAGTLPGAYINAVADMGLGFATCRDEVTGQLFNVVARLCSRLEAGLPPLIQLFDVGPVGEPIIPESAQMYARHKFLTLPFVEMRRDTGDRAERRRSGGRQAVAPFQIVTLRRRESIPRVLGAAVHGNECAARDWKHQWIVKGHWRKQWYPSRCTHEAIWIDAFMKGPEAAPLMERRQVIHQAVR